MQPEQTSEPANVAARQHIGRVIASYARSYPAPLAIMAGDIVQLSGKEDHWNGKPEWTFLWCVDLHGTGGWVPQTLIDRHGVTGIARQDYDCRELSVTAGETVEMGDEVSGWVWCTNQQGQQGWIPLACFYPIV